MVSAHETNNPNIARRSRLPSTSESTSASKSPILVFRSLFISRSTLSALSGCWSIRLQALENDSNYEDDEKKRRVNCFKQMTWQPCCVEALSEQAPGSVESFVTLVEELKIQHESGTGAGVGQSHRDSRRSSDTPDHRLILR